MSPSSTSASEEPTRQPSRESAWAMVAWPRVALLLVASVAAAGLATFTTARPNNYVAWNAVLDFLHLPVALLIAVMVAWALPTRWTHERRALLGVGAVGVAAVGVEVVQPMVGRSAELSDLALGGVGALLGGALFVARGRARVVVMAVAAAALGFTAVPSVRAWANVAERERSFPVLYDETQSGLAVHWRAVGDERNADVRAVATESGAVLAVSVRGPWEGLRYEASDQDWREYHTLQIRVLNRGPQVEYRLRVDDRTESGDRTRSNHVLVLEPGMNEISLTMDEIRHAPEDRALDLSAIDRVHFTLPPEQPATELWLYSVRLTRTP